MKIIGLAGTNGSGKDLVGQILARDYGYLFISITDILRDELKRRGLAIERENMRLVGNEWRRNIGLGVLVDKAVDIYEPQADKYKGLVVASLRNHGEVDQVYELGGRVVWVDADPKIRYQRVAARARDAESQMSYAEFLAEEQAEMERSGDEATLSLAEVKAMSDVFIENNGSISDLKNIVKEKLNLRS